MTESKHEHIFRKVNLRHRDGTRIVGGRRCECGLEVVGDGPFAINAAFIRSCYEANRSMIEALANFSRNMEKIRKKRFP